MWVIFWFAGLGLIGLLAKEFEFGSLTILILLAVFSLLFIIIEKLVGDHLDNKRAEMVGGMGLDGSCGDE